MITKRQASKPSSSRWAPWASSARWSPILADGGTLSLNFQVADVYRPVYYDGFLRIPIPIWVFAPSPSSAGSSCRTAFGRYCMAIGSNEQVARYSSIKVDNVRLFTYILQGVLVAVAVLLYVPRLGSASSTTGVLWELEAIAAVIIGGTTLKGGYGRIWGTVVGVLILGSSATSSTCTELHQPLSQRGLPGRDHHSCRAAPAGSPRQLAGRTCFHVARKERAPTGGLHEIAKP
jgi:ribose/xylose/arabinose/galactoside ABC-type transport system permease subunit